MTLMKMKSSSSAIETRGQRRRRRRRTSELWMIVAVEALVLSVVAGAKTGYEAALEQSRWRSRLDASQCVASLGVMVGCFVLNCINEPCTAPTEVTTTTSTSGGGGEETCDVLESEVCSLVDVACCPSCNEAAGAYLTCMLGTDANCPHSSCDGYLSGGESSLWMDRYNNTNVTMAGDDDTLSNSTTTNDGSNVTTSTTKSSSEETPDDKPENAESATSSGDGDNDNKNNNDNNLLHQASNVLTSSGTRHSTSRLMVGAVVANLLFGAFLGYCCFGGN